MSPCVILAVKESPLLLSRDFGSPDRGIISFMGDLQVCFTFSDWVWKASTHPVKVSTNAGRCFYPDGVDIWVKSNYQSSSRYGPQGSIDLSNEGGIGWVCALLWAHKSQAVLLILLFF